MDALFSGRKRRGTLSTKFKTDLIVHEGASVHMAGLTGTLVKEQQSSRRWMNSTEFVLQMYDFTGKESRWAEYSPDHHSLNMWSFMKPTKEQLMSYIMQEAAINSEWAHTHTHTYVFFVWLSGFNDFTQCSCSGAALVRCVSALNVFKTCSVTVKRAEPSGPTRHRASTSIIHTWGRRVCVGGCGGRCVCPDVARKSGFCCQLNGQTQLKWPQTPFIYSSTIFNWSAAEMEEHTHTRAHTYTHKHACKHTNTPGTIFKLHFLVVLYQQRKIPQSCFWWFHLTEHTVTKPEATYTVQKYCKM